MTSKTVAILEGLLECLCAALLPTGADAGPGPWDDDLLDIEGIYLQPGGEFLVGECDGQIVAMGALRRTSGERAEVRRVRVDPAFQRRGLGRRMLEALERRALELGYRELHLDTTPVQLAAMAMYEQLGYQEVGRGEWHGFEKIYFEKELPHSDT
ncbi:MAG: GNAT family N-acetyltransferase [Chloroflexota bacterium]|nr:GNAT family N-acetyltransferase [Chloroflexota bacterium]